MTGETEQSKPMEGDDDERMPFMDTFYSLSSNEASERNLAAVSLLEHIFSASGSGAGSNEAGNIKDGCYALTRLLKGLCSGRASARQGYASCLSSFLKIAFKEGPTGSEDKTWMDLFMESTESPTEMPRTSMTTSEFIRIQLNSHTTSLSESTEIKFGKKRGSEERDYHFGKLFGILAILRSGTLVVNKSCTANVLKGYLSDLLNLYNHKKWMREPATRAILELFSVAASRSGLDTVDSLIDGDISSLFWKKDKPWTAESIALYLHLQTLYMDSNESGVKIPKTIQKTLLTEEALSEGSENNDLVLALRETSSVVHPRCHLVWDSIWLHLTQSSGKKGSRKGHPIYNHSRVLRETDSGISSGKILAMLVQNVVIKALLGGDDEDNSDQCNVTHERRALALTLIQQLCALDLPTELVENVVLQPTVVKKLFLNTLQKSKKVHTLQPLAVHILQQIVDSLCAIDDLWTDACIERRLAISRSLLKASPSFDVVTQSQTVSLLLGLETTSGKDDEDADGESQGQEKIWKGHLTFLEGTILGELKADVTSIPKTVKYIDQMFDMAKKVMRIGSLNQRELIVKRTTLFYATLAFFNLEQFKVKNKEKKKLKGEEKISIEIASLVKESTNCDIPYSIRCTASSRFYSLLSDDASIPPSIPKEGSKVEAKTKHTLAVLGLVCSNIEILERFGAIILTKNERNAEEESLSLQAKSRCREVNRLVEKMTSDQEAGMKIKFISGIACLVSVLYVQRLQPGSPHEDDDEDDEDDMDEDVCEIISDLVEFATNVVDSTESDSMSSEAENDTNPLSSVAGTCVNILSSSIGGGSMQVHRGGVTRLVRDCIKIAWVGALSLSTGSHSSNESSSLVLDIDVMTILLESVCGPEALSDSNDDVESVEEDSDDISKGSREDDDELGASIFSQVAEAGMDVDDTIDPEEKSEHTDSDEVINENDKDEDVELDPSSLENMLMEESDSDEDVLEHHAGADSALAQLIKMKQQARKGARERRETIELSNRTRCLDLLESVFSSSNARNDILSNQIVLMSLLPLLRARRELAKSTKSIESASKKKGGLQSQKNALIDRISLVLKRKVCKCSLDGSANVESCIILAQQTVEELKLLRDPDHSSCCTSVFALILKAVSAHESNVNTLAKPIFIETMEEWSSKKSSRILSSFFDDMISKSFRLSRPSLLSPLISASQKARTPFLKEEAFRLLTQLFQVQESDDSAEKEVLEKESKPFATALEKAFHDEGLTKTKRLRDVLKAMEKLVSFASKYGSDDSKVAIGKLSSELKTLASNSKSAGVKNVCEQLMKEIHGWEDIKLIDEKPVKPKSSKKKKKKKGKKNN